MTATSSTAEGRVSPGEVLIWYTALDAIDEAEAQQRYRNWLSDDEQARLGRFLFAKHRHQFLVAHALVRGMVSHLLAGPPWTWQFRTVSNGRPELANQPGPGPRLRFNLSHTEGLVVCAATWDWDLGVDVEFLDRRPVSEGLPERYFSSSEVADLRALPSERQGRGFFDYWTLKEAYIKARGLGLALPLEKFSYHLGQPEITISFAPDLDDDPSQWQFAQFEPGPRHLISCAVRRPVGSAVRFRFASVLPCQATQA